MMYKYYPLLFFMLALSLSTPFEDKVASRLQGEVSENFPWDCKNKKTVTSICQTIPDFIETYLKSSTENILKESIAEKEIQIDNKEKTGFIVVNDKHMIFIYKAAMFALREIYAQKMMIDSSNKDLIVPITDCGTDATSTYFITDRHYSLTECIDEIRKLQPLEQLQLYINLLVAYRAINMQHVAHNAVNPNFIFFKSKNLPDLMKPRVGFFVNAWIKSARDHNHSYTLQKPSEVTIFLKKAKMDPASLENTSGMRDNSRSSSSPTRQERASSPSNVQISSRGKKFVPLDLFEMEYAAVVGLIAIVHMNILNNSKTVDEYFNAYKEDTPGFYHKYCPTYASTGILDVICDLRASDFKGEDPYYYGNIIASFEEYKKMLEKGPKTKL